MRFSPRENLKQLPQIRSKFVAYENSHKFSIQQEEKKIPNRNEGVQWNIKNKKQNWKDDTAEHK